MQGLVSQSGLLALVELLVGGGNPPNPVDGDTTAFKTLVSLSPNRNYFTKFSQ